jgi:hypothetical protein
LPSVRCLLVRFATCPGKVAPGPDSLNGPAQRDLNIRPSLRRDVFED